MPSVVLGPVPFDKIARMARYVADWWNMANGPTPFERVVVERVERRTERGELFFLAETVEYRPVERQDDERSGDRTGGRAA